ncbi:branched-chain amino acid aminotransferase II [Tilletiaria anomala UBC 951]|uniref:Branched-chain-amino-acid aminotransferase n=1 Tax=Tilletiaria anomala (strain ATCC 24038 / CBS 436.72 / UBC 951) TaxID=1037660 RepID=A0A066VUC2_TILAU|nr:branched-chain amino acid aminotransferase II [Tilletiaria anomala UBC 951]KDN45101.1 branched-chain amino acid aminotransferase II [Tilletiaria anomala UBC 951]
MLAASLRTTARRQAACSSRSLRFSTSTLVRDASKPQQIDPMTGEVMGLSTLDASSLKVTKTQQPKTVPPSSSLVFGQNFSDHMLSVPWNAQTGWAPPHIHPYGPLHLDPSSVIFHYAPSLFEGMKAYKDVNGGIRLFRPDMNMKRLNVSADRIALPAVDGEQLTTLIKKLVSLDKHWIPADPGHSLYIRPTLIGTQQALGVFPTTEALLFVICSPVGPYYRSGFKPVALEADPSKVRAWPGGTGQYKLGLNYAPGIKMQVEAAKSGYQQNLWLFGEEHWLTEVGTMNMFVVIKNKDGATELITPPLNGMILPGVTRASILELARDHLAGKFPIDGLPSDLIVSEREINMAEVVEAEKSGCLLEMFGAGTAAIVSPVERLGYMGRDIRIPTSEEGVGPIAKVMLNTITGIQLGKIEHPWSVVVDENI